MNGSLVRVKVMTIILVDRGVQGRRTGKRENDHWALANGYVAITPTVVDVTAYGFMNELSKWFE